jgi:hypothetical protein
MGREIKRVPLDFAWPPGKVWEGFLNPHYGKRKPCSACDGSGLSPEAHRLKQLWYGYESFHPADRASEPFAPDHYLVRSLAERNVGSAPDFYGAGDGSVAREARRLCGLFNSQWSHHLNQDDVDALVAEGRLMDLTHEWRAGEGWKPKIPARHPSAVEVNEWALFGFGHDSINQWIVVRAECVRLGVDYGCATCGGDGDWWPADADKILYEAWIETPPPEGEGWQLWETVSEGSPISPVFATEEEMVWHMVTECGNSEASARAFVRSGWAPSMVMIDGEVKSGVEAMGEMEAE